MKIAVHDYSGHPFQVELSRELARRGHRVTHLYSSEFETPKGALARRDGDPEGFDVVAIRLGSSFRKSNLLRRRIHETRYGTALATALRDLDADVVVSSNTPLDAQRIAMAAVRERSDRAFVFWLQDLYGEAIYRILSRRFGLAGRMVGRHYKALEARLAGESDRTIAITADFVPILTGMGVEPSRIDVVENWAPLDEIALAPKDNDWSRREGVGASFNVVYTGTLGYKHNPSLLVELARSLDANVMVFSEGEVARDLAASQPADSRLSVRPWVRFEELPLVLGAADIVVALIEPDAGIFSVPSKVLTYMAAGRPVLAAMPADNLAARILKREGAGLVTPPGDVGAFVAAARRLRGDPALREEMGKAGRSYATANFDIGTIGDRFEAILEAAIAGRRRVAGTRSPATRPLRQGTTGD